LGAVELVTPSLTADDLAIVRDVGAWRTSVATSLAHVVSYVVVIGPAASLGCIALWRRDRRAAAIVGCSTLGTAVLFNVDKLLVGRPRRE
jgi:hypothetical protein